MVCHRRMIPTGLSTPKSPTPTHPPPPIDHRRTRTLTLMLTLVQLGSSVTEKFCSGTMATGWLVIDHNQTNHPGSWRSRRYSRPHITLRIHDKDRSEQCINTHTHTHTHTQSQLEIIRACTHTSTIPSRPLSIFKLVYPPD